MVLLIHRPYDPAKPAGSGRIAKVIIAKQRNGPTGIVELEFDGKYVCFQEPPELRAAS